MSELISVLIIAIVQGITEWLPVSSSGHLIIASHLLKYELNLDFMVALHFGTLLAIFIYFGKDIINIIRDILNLDLKSRNTKLGISIIIATIPAWILGLILKDFIEKISNDLLFLSMGLAITSMILFIGSIDLSIRKKELKYKGALLIGLAQVLSLFRGISRSGSTISSGLLLGLSEKEAVKFSFLLSIPIVLGANIITIGNKTLPSEYLWASLASFFVGLCMIHISFTRILNNKKNLRWLGVYTLLLALIIGIFLLIK